ncbi:MAG: hypothetical protein HW411_621, partial [Gammaproteobacteria bacterium]|nr:hypothetical protein [Gammaproteobacteria bacterium]
MSRGHGCPGATHSLLCSRNSVLMTQYSALMCH